VVLPHEIEEHPVDDLVEHLVRHGYHRTDLVTNVPDRR
jgi:hypothetical protein